MAAERSARKGTSAIWWIILGAVALRVAFAAVGVVRAGGPQAFYAADSRSYIRPAEELLAHGRFWTDDHAELFRTPGYPVMLLPGIILGSVEYVTVALQIGLSALTIWLVWVLARRVTGDDLAALVAAASYAIEPVALTSSVQLLSETLAAVFIVVTLVLVTRYLDDRRARWAVGAGVALAAATYVRPITTYLPILIVALALVWAALRRADGWRVVAHSLLFFAVTIGALVPWIARNRAVADYSGLAVVGDSDLYFYCAVPVIAEREGVPVGVLQERLGWPSEQQYFAVHPDRRGLTPGARYRAMRADALDVMRQAPIASARNMLRGMVRVIVNPGTGPFHEILRLYPPQADFSDKLIGAGPIGSAWVLLRERPGLFWLALFIAGFMGAAYLFAATSLAVRSFRTNPAVIAFLAVAAYFVVTGGPGLSARLRHPIMPIVCIFAGQGLVAVIDWWRRRKAAPEADPDTRTSH